MSAFLKPFNLLIIVNLLISCFALSSEEIKEIPNQHGLILKKVYGEHNIPLELEETGRVDTYKGDAEKYSLESPFGVYLAYDNNILIGAQAIDHTLKNDTLMGSVTTDILDTYQGKGYGTKLRKATGEFIRDTYFGKNVVIDSKQGISSSPLTFLHSDNEWMWGENMPSLMTALKAGYQIACIGSSSTLQMLLTQEERIKAGLWSEKRTKYLTEIGRMLSDPSSYFKEGFKQNLSDLLQALDLTQETDIVTFFRLWEKAFNDSIVARFETVAS
ncbi:hypothetical protein, partial [Candidatus Paracaedibacter symbiosus]|uniref:hypothetical protein n=1 Tax=Candidatus Paracaedibacter symbiosus TaxID=244582 RepID=UPI00050990B0